MIIKVISLTLTKEEKNLDQSKLQDRLKALLGKAGKGVKAGQLEDTSKLLSELTYLGVLIFVFGIKLGVRPSDFIASESSPAMLAATEAPSVPVANNFLFRLMIENMRSYGNE